MQSKPDAPSRFEWNHPRDIEWPSHKQAWTAVAILTLIQGINAIDRNLINLLVGPIKADLQISDTQVGLLLGFAFALFYTTMGLPIGRLADAISRKKIIFCGTLFWSATTMACGVAQNYTQLFLARIAVGAGEATLNPSGYSLISDCFPPEKRAKPMGVFIMGYTIGAGVALFIGGILVKYLIDHQITWSVPGIGELRPWQIAFLCAGFPGLFLGFLLLKIREPKRQGLMAPISDNAKTNSLPVRQVVGYFFQHAGLYLPIFIGFGLILVWEMGKSLWAPTFLIRTYGMDEAKVGLVLGTIVVVFMSAGAVSSGWASEWLSNRGHRDAPLRAALYGALLCIPFALGAMLADIQWVSLALLCPVYFLGSFPFALAPAVVSTITPNQMRGQITALYLLVINLLGYGVGPALIGGITDYVFVDEAMLKYSMALTGLVTLLLASVALKIAIKRYLMRVDANS